MISEPQFDVSFDWDGTLTSGDGPIGQDNGAVIDLAPLQACLDAGLSCAIMTCNQPSYVAGVLREHQIPVFCDEGFLHKIPHPDFDGMVLVTQRKVLARVYADDRGLRFRWRSHRPGYIVTLLQHEVY